MFPIFPSWGLLASHHGIISSARSKSLIIASALAAASLYVCQPLTSQSEAFGGSEETTAASDGEDDELPPSSRPYAVYNSRGDSPDTQCSVPKACALLANQIVDI